MPERPQFNLTPVPDAVVASLLAANRSQVMCLVEKAYTLFDRGEAIEVPPSYLRPTHDTRARIIAKPACLYGDVPIAGLKWVGSFPENLALGLPRASGLLILNDMQTGLPCGSMEVAAINAHRTSASAVLALGRLHGRPKGTQPIAIIGTGVIGWQVAEYLVHDGWVPTCWVLHDLDRARAQAFAERLQSLTPQVPVQLAQQADQAMVQGEIVVFTTSAGTPHLGRPAWRPDERPVVFSPFGMAILDLAVGQWVLKQRDGALRTA